MPSSSSNREHRLQHWRAEAPASRQVQGFDLVTPWHFCFHFSHSFQRNQKISDFVGNTAFWFAWGQCFTLKLFFFLLYIYTHIYINLHTWYKRLILRKKKKCFPLLEHATFLKNFASWKKAQSFLWFGLTALQVVFPGRQKNLVYPQLPPSSPHLTVCCCNHKKDGNRR